MKLLMTCSRILCLMFIGSLLHRIILDCFSTRLYFLGNSCFFSFTRFPFSNQNKCFHLKIVNWINIFKNCCGWMIFFAFDFMIEFFFFAKNVSFLQEFTIISISVMLATLQYTVYMFKSFVFIVQLIRFNSIA